MEITKFNPNTTVQEVREAFGKAGKLLFPVNLPISENDTLKSISNSSTYMWYSEIQVNKTVEILNYLKTEQEKRQIFYPIYSKAERKANSELEDTGIYYFKGKKDAPFSINNAGGGFYYVAAMHDSFPHALELSKRGFNAFALIYRVNDPYADLARALEFIYDHAKELEINREHYSLWGGSAGARMAAVIGNLQYLRSYTERTDIQQADSVIMEYTGYSRVSKYDAPTFVAVGDRDGIANWQVMRQRLFYLSELGIPTEFHVYPGLSHGFGLGTGTVADGWINEAIQFWKNNMKK
ncbi:alpha/beta hydrolase [Lactobacillus sp. LL6]|uniref:alpha/beta hydrolase n=1 Tax=Lactobacillus sp. LL6 TaxID=2596827 RepID=UPI001186C5A5|nr:alpha/beta hydrolase [Lactobacillus sp. LL6]TSO25370.1 alpha/beta hydrolase [Lactobacillus sp. LL6]